MDQDGIVAIGLLTRHDLNLLGPTFDRLWPVEDAPQFVELLHAIDRADEALAQRPSGDGRCNGSDAPVVLPPGRG